MFSSKTWLFVALAVVVFTVNGGVAKEKKKASNVDCPQMKLKRQWGGKPAQELNYQVRMGIDI